MIIFKSSAWLKRTRKYLATILKTNKFYKRKYQLLGLDDPKKIKSWNDFQKLPLTRRSELAEDQIRFPPFGSNLTYPLRQYTQVDSTSGTSSGKSLYCLSTGAEYKTRVKMNAMNLRKMGVKSTDRFMAMVPDAMYSILEAAAVSIGALVVSPFHASTEKLLAKMSDTKTTVFFSSSSAMLNILKEAKKIGFDLSRLYLRLIITSGEAGASIPFIHKRISTAFKAEYLDNIGSHEAIIVGYGCRKNQGVHFQQGFNLYEIINPETGKGDSKGELVLTTLWRVGMPLIRYRTGDYVEIETSCPCGDKAPLIKGGMKGRIDGMIRLNALPGFFSTELEKIVWSFPEIQDFRAELIKRGGLDRMLLRVELPSQARNKVIKKLKLRIHQSLSHMPVIIPMAVGSLKHSEWKTKRIIDNRFTESRVKRVWGKLRSLTTKLLGY